MRRWLSLDPDIEGGREYGALKLGHSTKYRLDEFMAIRAWCRKTGRFQFLAHLIPLCHWSGPGSLGHDGHAAASLHQ